MRRTLAAASACLGMAALAAPALARQPLPPPPSDAPPAPDAVTSSTTTTTTTTTTGPSPDYVPPPPAAYAAPPPPPYPAGPPRDDQGAPMSNANPGVRVGVLTCRAAGGWGMLIGSRRPIDCIYQGNHGTEHYSGDLTKIGLDIGYKGRGEVIWTVVAPTGDIARGDLAGHYGGITAGASAIVGVAANAMIGGNGHQVSLQPLSVEGNTGINASAGIGGMDLTYVGTTS